jgi:hypothetical protein
VASQPSTSNPSHPLSLHSAHLTPVTSHCRLIQSDCHSSAQKKKSIKYHISHEIQIYLLQAGEKRHRSDIRFLVESKYVLGAHTRIGEIFISRQSLFCPLNGGRMLRSHNSRILQTSDSTSASQNCNISQLNFIHKRVIVVLHYTCPRNFSFKIYI